MANAKGLLLKESKQLSSKKEIRERKYQLKNLISGGVVQPYSCFLNNGIKVAFVSYLENVATSSSTGEANKKGGVGYAGIPLKIPANICFTAFRMDAF